MAVEKHPSGFGKRAVHRVWSDRLPQAEFISFSQARGWTAVAVLTLRRCSFISCGIGARHGRSADRRGVY
jgi:hypothetical protein